MLVPKGDPEAENRLQRHFMIAMSGHNLTLAALIASEVARHGAGITLRARSGHPFTHHAQRYFDELNIPHALVSV